MNKKLLLSLLSVLFLASAVVIADETTTESTTTNSYPQSPQFGQRMTPPNMDNSADGSGLRQPPQFGQGNSGDGSDFRQPPQFKQGNSADGSDLRQPPQMNGQGRPDRQPDSKPGGDRTPPEWSNQTESNN